VRSSAEGIPLEGRLVEDAGFHERLETGYNMPGPKPTTFMDEDRSAARDAQFRTFTRSAYFRGQPSNRVVVQFLALFLAAWLRPASVSTQFEPVLALRIMTS
jgi:hypothetical protein